MMVLIALEDAVKDIRAAKPASSPNKMPPLPAGNGGAISLTI
jgi:hypothetical protein